MDIGAPGAVGVLVRRRVMKGHERGEEHVITLSQKMEVSLAKAMQQE